MPGSGDAFYCGNCFRDYLYVQALRSGGHEVVVMPLYLPLTDPSFLADTPLFFPAVSYYVAQKFLKKGILPRFPEKILNTPALLRFASSFSGTTSAKGMEQMTLSMVQGHDIHFAAQIEKIVTCITHHNPDIIHISSSLLIGLTKAIKNRVETPIVCSLQDEEIWIDSLERKYAATVWESIRENVKYVDRFITSSEFYKSIALNKIPEFKEINVVYPGVAIEQYATSHYPSDPTIGFFYHMNRQSGLDILSKAFVLLKKEKRCDNLKLRIGGGFTSADKKFLREVRKILSPFKDDVTWHLHYKLVNHAQFYAGISIICVPITFEESAGLYLCEAFASGRPAIEPNTGSFSELMQDGGILYHPNRPEALAEAIEKLCTNEHLYKECIKNGDRLAQSRYNYNVLSTKLQQVYEGLLDAYIVK